MSSALMYENTAYERSSVQLDSDKYLSFRVSGDSYAVSIMRIKEIIEYGEVELTAIPMVPEMIVGALNLRGHAVPVIDLSICMHHKACNATHRTCVIIMEIQANGQKADVGVIVDAVSEVLTIQSRDIEPSPSMAGNIRTDFIDGMGKINGRFVILLKIDRMLSPDALNYLSNNVNSEECDVT